MISQLPLHLRDSRWRPTADMDGVKWALDLEAEDVEPLIDGGDLFAFNIAVRGSRRRELRFLTRSIEHYHATLGARKQEFTLPQIMQLLVPHEKPFIHGTEIDTALNCDPDHRQNLIRAGQLDVIPIQAGRDWRPGPGGSPAVTRDSFRAFLLEAHKRSFTT